MTRFDTGTEVTLESGVECDGPRALLLESRVVPLGGVRAMEVHRSLPQRDLPLVGAWCFLDRFGPQVTRMRVEPHPHVGLQTVTWPFEGEVHHRDSVDSDVVVRRGALNLMTSGAGISHSEYSVGDAEIPLDALQLWVALPESRRHGPPAFERHENLPLVDLGAGATAIVVLGELAGVTSPATTYTPIVGAEVTLPAASTVRIPLRPEWEHALVGVTGSAVVGTAPSAVVEQTGPAVAGAVRDGDAVAGTPLENADLLYLGTRREGVTVSSDEGATLFLLGGTAFDEEIVMWWNFVGRSHEEIVAAREDWQAGDARFGHVIGHGDERIPAPPMPAVRLTRRRRRV